MKEENKLMLFLFGVIVLAVALGFGAGFSVARLTSVFEAVHKLRDCEEPLPMTQHCILTAIPEESAQ